MKAYRAALTSAVTLLFACLFALHPSVGQAAIALGSYTFAGDVTPQDQSGGPYNMQSSSAPGMGQDGYSVLRFVPLNQTVPFQDYTNLTYNYDVNAGGIGGGSPRVVIVLDSNNDLAADKFVTLYWGPPGTFVDGTQGNGLTTGNLLSLTDNGRYDLSDPSIGGSPYTDRTAALAAAGTDAVLRFSLILDTYAGSPAGDQNFDINSIGVGANVATVPEAASFLVWACVATIGIVGIRRYTASVARSQSAAVTSS